MTEWKQARKKPIIISFRKVEPKIQIKEGEMKPYLYNEELIVAEIGTIRWGEEIETLEGTLYAYTDRDFIIRGVKGEIYPIKKSIFKETYDVLETPYEAYVKMKEAEKRPS